MRHFSPLLSLFCLFTAIACLPAIGQSATGHSAQAHPANKLKPADPLKPAESAAQPNILLIVADDLGFSDLGCYGGEIDTPNLDRLAQQGVRFSEYHVNPMCVVTRTSLMTGHTHNQSDGYRRSIPLPGRLADAGYHTSLSGKWHQPGNPLNAGFADFYGFLGGAIDSWNGHYHSPPKPHVQRNRQAPHTPAEGWYATDAFTDHALKQIDAALDQNQPFFTFVSYNAPHSPLHVSKDLVDKYVDRYRVGWDQLRQERYLRLLEMGLIDERYVLSKPEAEIRPWDELSQKERDLEAWRFAAYAGMVDRMDWNIGRLLAYLDQRGIADNTVVLFMSDNGGDYGNGDTRTARRQLPWEAGSHPFAASGWSYLRCTPFRWYKSCAHEGGVSVPLILRWPAQKTIAPGSILHQRLHVTDLYPTFLALAGDTKPTADPARGIAPLYGQSMLPLLKDPTLPPLAIHDEMFWAFNTTGKGLTLGDWKIASISDGPWKLYNITQDPAEANNLADQHPRILKRLSDRWFHFAEHETTMPAAHRQPLKTFQEGWGYHRIRMTMPSYIRAEPAGSAVNVPINTDLTFYFTEPISFKNSSGKRLYLYDIADPQTPVWSFDPEPGHPAEGTKTLRLTNVPRLKPDTHYVVRTDRGWITLGGRPAIALNDGAFWYRFRTAPRP